MRSSWSPDRFLLALLFLCHGLLATNANNSSRAVPPGDTPFRFCNGTNNTDIFTISLLQLDPKPVLMDQVFRVNVYGELSKDIPSNSTLKARAIFENYPPAANFTIDFCENVNSITQPGNSQCPPKKGGVLIVFWGYTSPYDMPPGNYWWQFEALTPQTESIFCVEAEVCIERGDGDPRNHGKCPPVKERSNYMRNAQQVFG
ncbi:hypothetical protein BCR34DRAFT_18787 [Clohesyomyces aquaticus]|uniref:Phosphatidylglycerol/phosphatidylinositol transfer protein n=1 Tax=Clohesyomyces aquaticus TaxID=1231657 RepID=A0A1Y1ZCI8_9PLEO|nr:hypothetical protein BCR34DRAFT_18787 [Clohesyomyces aquaticus]